jgi:predicted DsbA family dithiol-disulfide isomerase
VRLDRVAENYGDRVELSWRSFMLRPEPEERSMEAFTSYTSSWSRPAELETSITFNQWSGDHEPPSHSLPSAVAGKVAATFGPEAYQDFHLAVMAAYFTDNRTISDWDVLVDVATGVGIDGDEFARRRGLSEEGLVGEIVTEHNEAVGAGISGVPALVVGERYLVPGAVEVSQYHEVIDRFLADRAQGLT